MQHLDLFSGIGGFALAVDTVWPDATHTFVEIDPFCQAVLRKHWPGSEIYADIKTFTNTTSERLEGRHSSRPARFTRTSECYLITGGFPCQPFSAAGRRKGTADDRYLWPEMFRVIREFSPTWVIAENVRGLTTWNEGMVLETVCSDLENQGYEVWPLIIPACAVNAPHRRERVWFVANRTSGWKGCGKPKRDSAGESKTQVGDDNSNAQAPLSERGGGRLESGRQVLGGKRTKIEDARSSWQANWVEVATELCRVDDGLPAELDGLTLSKSAHRRERLKALGNAIVPQVAVEIMKAIHATI